MKYSDKTFMGMTTSGKNAEDVLDMCAILFGAEFMEGHAVVTGNCNGNSPLVWDATMLGGANTPASTAPAVAQLNAEVLSALTYTQVIRKGAPAIYGHYLSTVSMQSGAPMAGTPEISLMNSHERQLVKSHHWSMRSPSLVSDVRHKLLGKYGMGRINSHSVAEILT